MELKDFYYELPEELIAQDPLEDRASSRLMVLHRESGEIEHRHFRDITEYLKPGDCLVFGRETSGLPDDVQDSLGADHLLRLPMRPHNRSLNLSNAVAVTVFEAWRQQGFEGAAS